MLVERGACTVEGDAWRPTAPDGESLHVRPRELDGVRDAVVDLGLGEPPVRVASVPHCGCDACDDGSEMLLRHLDDVVEHVVTGDLLALPPVHGLGRRNAAPWL